MVERLRRDARGGVALMFALLAPLLVITAFGIIDISSVFEAKTHLQDSTDAAALAVSAADSANPNTAEAALKTIATNLVAADFTGGTASITSFAVCSPTQTTDCATTPSGTPIVTDTVSIATQVRASCWAPVMLPGVCTNGSQSMLITVKNTTNIGFPANIQINLVLDTSGSMIVGATANDVQAVVNWNNVTDKNGTLVNWNSIRDQGDSNSKVPCAFACHDFHSSNSTTYGSAGSDMQQGLTNAHAAGATTRFDVMVSAASALLSHEQQNVANNTQLAKNSYYVNVYSVADALTQTYSATAANDWTDPQTAISNLYVGMDTHMNQNLPTLATQVGVNGTGSGAASPQKFVILVTDGVQSDFNSDFTSCTGYPADTAWNVSPYQAGGALSPGWPGVYGAGCYAQPMSSAACTTMKKNGVVLAVLETPYVPLTGQDPGEYDLYETFVRHTIYPGGPNSSSTVSAALSACATTGYYFQANNSSDIATGFIDLTDKFLASTAYIRN